MVMMKSKLIYLLIVLLSFPVVMAIAPTHNTPILNTTFNAQLFGFAGVFENLTVFPQNVTSGSGSFVFNNTDWRLYNGTVFNSVSVLNFPFEGSDTDATTTSIQSYSYTSSNVNMTYVPTGGFWGGGTYQFDGADASKSDYIQINDNDALDLLDNFTIETLVYIETITYPAPSGNNYAYIVCKQTAGGFQNKRYCIQQNR